MSREVPLAGSPKGHCGCLVTSFKLPGHQSALGDRFYRSLHMSQNLEEVDFIFSERAMDEAICNLHNLGFCDQDPILVADLIKKEYITHELQHFRPIPWLIRVASLTEKGLKRVQTVEAEDLLKPENERLTKDTEYDLNVMDEVYMGFLLFSPKRIQDELKMGRHAYVARLGASNAVYMDYDDFLSRRYPEYFKSCTTRES